MDIRPLDADTMLAEACCGSGYRLLRDESELSDEDRTIVRAARMKVEWLDKMMPKGLSAQIAYENDRSVGFIEYMPIGLSNSHQGRDLYIINCMMAPHTPPFPDPLQNPRIPGRGSALVNAMIEDVKGKCGGIVTPPGFAYTPDMRGFFTRFGFREFENEGLKMLILRFRPDVQLPSPVRLERTHEHEPLPGRIVVDMFWSSMCPLVGPWTLLNIREVAREFGDNVIVNDVCIDDRDAAAKHGIARWSEVFINGERLESWGPPEKEQIRDRLRAALDMDESAGLA